MKNAEEYKDFLSKIANVINDNDPIHLLASGAPVDEYLGEVSRIAPLVKVGMSENDLADQIYHVFVRSFDKSTADSSPRNVYEKMAREILGFFDSNT